MSMIHSLSGGIAEGGLVSTSVDTVIVKKLAPEQDGGVEYLDGIVRRAVVTPHLRQILRRRKIATSKDVAASKDRCAQCKYLRGPGADVRIGDPDGRWIRDDVFRSDGNLAARRDLGAALADPIRHPLGRVASTSVRCLEARSAGQGGQGVLISPEVKLPYPLHYVPSRHGAVDAVVDHILRLKRGTRQSFKFSFEFPQHTARCLDAEGKSRLARWPVCFVLCHDNPSRGCYAYAPPAYFAKRVPTTCTHGAPCLVAN